MEQLDPLNNLFDDMLVDSEDGNARMQQQMEEDEISEEDYQERLDEAIAAALIALREEAEENKRGPKFKYKRIDWDHHILMLVCTKSFQETYRMSFDSFNKLVDLLAPFIQIDEQQSKNSTQNNEPIHPPMIVGSGLKFLSGDNAKSISQLYGISKSSCIRIIELMLNAVMACKDLEIRLPATKADKERLRADWAELSTGGGIMLGFAGAIDGWLVCTEQPFGKGVSPRDYFSGHYQRFGLNVQAVCDSRLRFIYFTVAAPGKTGDSRAFRRLEELRKWIRDLPEGCFIGGDNAYPLSIDLLCPYPGKEKFDEHKRIFNYYFSQLRIRIEMTFGLMSTKWRIFRTNLNFSLKKNILICEAAARLHNFIIDNDSSPRIRCPNTDFSMMGEDKDYEESREETGAQSCSFGTHQNEKGEYTRTIHCPLGWLPNIPDNVDPQNTGKTARRDAILAKIIQRKLSRPWKNKKRNNGL